MVRLMALTLTLTLARSACSQTAVPPASSPVTATMVLRERTNATQWFSATPKAEQYGYQDSLLRLGIQQRIGRFDYQLEIGQSAEFALPSDAVSPVAAQGQLGLGGTYYASNGNNRDPAAASFRTGYLRYHFTRETDSVLLGRFEFLDGQEIAPKNRALAWVQTNRISQRLIGNFGFSNGQRSFDGVEGKAGGASWNLTAMAGRLTQGVFNMNANPELNVDIQYVAYTHAFAGHHVLARGFALGYHDGRTGVVKTDNRPLAARQADHRNIRIGTYGGDVLLSAPAGKYSFDLMFWGVLQNGQWGLLEHRAGAFAAEGGFRFDHAWSRPWIRGGISRTTGDANPSDAVHNTFFQVLPTPRIYARYPFFNMMNSKDEFVQLVDAPSSKLEVRTDVHFLQLTAPLDLWYQGGGPFDDKAFGYVGRPGNNHRSFSTLYDMSADYAIGKRFSLGAYYAHAFGKTVVGTIYPTDRESNYGYFELDYKLSKEVVRRSTL